MKLLITILVLTAPLVLSLRTRRASFDESNEDDFPPLTTVLPPSSSPSAASLHLPPVINNLASPTTSYTLTTITQAPEDFPNTPSVTSIGPSTTPGPTTQIPWDPTTIETEFLIPPISLVRPPLPPASLHLPPVTNNLATPTPIMQVTESPTTTRTTVLPPSLPPASLHLPPVTNNLATPTPIMQVTESPTTTRTTVLPPSLPPASLHLPPVTNNLTIPTTSYTPTSTTTSPPQAQQPRTTSTTANRQPFHDACSTIFTAEESKPMRGDYVLCVFNIANYHDQVHYHQTIHNNYNA